MFENLPGGGRNDGVVDLFASTGNRIVVRFPFAPTRNGLAGQNIQVEVRALDLGFDISGVGVRAVFA